MECGWEGRIQWGHFSPSKQACDWLPSVSYWKQKPVGGFPITYKTAAATGLMCIPTQQTSYKWAPATTKHFKKDVLKITAYLFDWQAAVNPKMLLQQFQARKTEGASEERASPHPSLFCIKHTRHKSKESRNNPLKTPSTNFTDPTEHITGTWSSVVHVPAGCPNCIWYKEKATEPF